MRIVDVRPFDLLTLFDLAIMGADGYTIYLDNIVPDRGFVVGGAIPGFVAPLPVDSYQTTELRRGVGRWLGVAKATHPTVKVDTLGFWVDGGNVHFDLGTWHWDRDKAIQVGAERDRPAIWDIEYSKRVDI